MSIQIPASNLSMPNQWAQSKLVCFNKNQITLHCNQSGVSILTELKTLEWWISRLMLKLLVLLNPRLV